VVSLESTAAGTAAALGQTLAVDFATDIRITMGIQLKGRSSGRVQVLFWNTELLPVMDVVAEDLSGFVFNTDANGFVQISTSITGPNLNAGKYNLSVIVLGDDDTVLCRHDGALSVNVSAHSGSGAHVLKVAEWSVDTHSVGNELPPSTLKTGHSK
ncbi:MAG: hypothetical protein GY758_02625, partial [Fuerstiella sp.]|nr:hypothetical protein [Fuerstiella sp.]